MWSARMALATAAGAEHLAGPVLLVLVGVVVGFAWDRLARRRRRRTVIARVSQRDGVSGRIDAAFDGNAFPGSSRWRRMRVGRADVLLTAGPDGVVIRPTGRAERAGLVPTVLSWGDIRRIKKVASGHWTVDGKLSTYRIDTVAVDAQSTGQFRVMLDDAQPFLEAVARWGQHPLDD